MTARRLGPWIAALAGLVGLALLARHVDWQATARAVRESGWAAVGVTAARAATLATAAVGWWRLMPRGGASLGSIAQVRTAREGINLLLPFTAVGGDVIGARLLARRGVPGAVAAATTLVDMLMLWSGQLVFTLTGVALLATEGHSRVALWVLPGVLVAGAALGGFLLFQRGGGARWIDRAAASAGERWPELIGDRPFNLREQLTALYARPGAVLANFALHLTGWALDAAAPWLVLTALGYAPTWSEAVVIESLAQALRGAAFFVPAGIGVQEGGLVFLCGLYGVPPEAALTLALVRRVSDVVIGTPGLLLWWRIEALGPLRAVRTRRSTMLTRP